MSLFVWLLPFDLSGLDDPTSSYATADVALRVAETRKLPHHVQVETLSRERATLASPFKMSSTAIDTSNVEIKIFTAVAKFMCNTLNFTTDNPVHTEILKPTIDPRYDTLPCLLSYFRMSVEVPIPFVIDISVL